jgi:hypothetical protein
MAHLISLSIDATKVTKARMKDGKYINITINISDEVDKYGNNVSAWENQTKDERDSKAKRNYLGNGRVLFTEGDVFKPGKQEESSNHTEEDNSDMPF